ncbi:hypothetical protein PTKIN_Ptkin06aG0030900 [Pterospermum kingtungense]
MIYWAIGLAGGLSGLFFFFLTISATFCAGNSLVAFVSGVFPDCFIAFIMVTAAITYFLFFSGYLVSRIRLQKYWLWLHYISLIKYPYEALLINEFRPSKCFARGAQVFQDSPLEELPKSLQSSLLNSLGDVLGMTNNVTASTCMTKGDYILKRQGITQLNKWNSLLVTVAWGFFYTILFYFTLLFLNKNKRK